MMNIHDFKNNLDIYGSDIDAWPENIRKDAKTSLSSSVEHRNMLDEEKLLEEALNLRSFEDPSDDLEARILNASLRKNFEPDTQSKSFFGFLNGIFNSFHLPKPAFALSMILVIGITLGYIGNTNQQQASVNSEDLLASEINFYDGDFYE